MDKVDNIIQVNNYGELLDTLFYDSWNNQLGRYRSQYAYRGLSDSKHQLVSTLIRLGGKFKDLEKHLLRNFKKYAYGDFVQKDSIWHWLSLAQHHGLPTRLLDWTFSPLVALHFATANIETSNNDGVIWAVNYAKAHELLPDKVKIELDKEGSDLFTVDILANLFQTLQEFDELYKDDFLIFFEPPSLDGRIINQYSLFSVFSDSGAPLEGWLEQHPKIWRKIIIPYKLKWEIRDKLDQSNITERVLFPGLDGLSRWLKRHYSPKNA
jgi:hypothetical protein